MTITKTLNQLARKIGHALAARGVRNDRTDIRIEGALTRLHHTHWFFAAIGHAYCDRYILLDRVRVKADRLVANNVITGKSL